MKKLLIILISIPLISLSQIKVPKIFQTESQGILTYDQANNIEFAKEYRDNTKFDAYVTKDKVTIKNGDTLTIGYAINKNINNEYAKNDVFTNIFVGDVKNRNIEECEHLAHNYSETKVIVNSIYVKHYDYTGYKTGLWNSKKNTALYVNLFVKPLNNGSIVSNILGPPRITILNLEENFLTNEMINPNPPMTRSEAIAKLKESKDLMELGLITEEEYLKSREDLLPVINQE